MRRIEVWIDAIELYGLEGVDRGAMARAVAQSLSASLATIDPRAAWRQHDRTGTVSERIWLERPYEATALAREIGRAVAAAIRTKALGGAGHL